MTNIKHPQIHQIEMILNKAELLYLESVKKDFAKVRDGEKVEFFDPEEIKSLLDDNKNNFLHVDFPNKDSILNESEEMGVNYDLMNFFQGVRNYQNWEDDLEKRTIEKLKKFTIQAENELTLRKGFIISKIEKIIDRNEMSFKKEFLGKLRRGKVESDKLSVISKIERRILENGIDHIKAASKTKSSSLKLQELMIDFGRKSNKNLLVSGFKSLTKTIKALSSLMKCCSHIHNRKKLQYSSDLFKRLSIKIFSKYERLGRGVERITKICKKLAVKEIIKAKGILYVKCLESLSKLFNSKLQQSFAIVSEFSKMKVALKSAVSLKMKGKILLSIQRHETKPINIKKVFLNWYLKGHEEKYSKMMYNIWLNGNISKFTFFMRLKNVVYEGKKQKIRQELKIFLMILSQKMNNYYNHCQKGFLNRWKDRFRECKRLLHFAHVLEAKAKKIDLDIVRESHEKIAFHSKNKKTLSRYFNKRITVKTINFKNAFDVWKTIPNIKKSKGQVKLLSFLREKLNKMEEDQREVYETFKKNHIKGESIKVKFVTKAFTKDLLYLSNFLNIWRRNVFSRKTSEKFIEEKKTHALKSIELFIKKQEATNTQESISKFVKMSQFNKNRREYTFKVFEALINRNEKNGLAYTFLEFHHENNAGLRKKEQLVFNLVSANKMKQSQSLYIWLTIQRLFKNKEKQSRVESSFKKITNIVGNRLSYNRPVYHTFSKISNNYYLNVGEVLKTLRSLPPRVNWTKRRSAINFFNKIDLICNKNKLSTYEKFKENFEEGHFKKYKIFDLMHFKHHQILKTNFNALENNVAILCLVTKTELMSNIFERLALMEKENFSLLFGGDKLWVKKASSFNKLNRRVNERLHQAFKLWEITAKSFTKLKSHQNEVKLLKKKSPLIVLEGLIRQNQQLETSKCISMFTKNSKIILLQTNFLRKLCDTQAGKTQKAFMIWKNLPKITNKDLITRATKFEKNLSSFASKLLRTTVSRFKDDHYFGNDRKKMAIRKLVARSCTGIAKYFEIWKKNNQLTTLFSQCHHVENLHGTMLRQVSENFRLLFEGNEAKKIEECLESVEKWWLKHEGRLLLTWKRKVAELKYAEKKKEESILKIGEMVRDVEKKKVQNILIGIKKRLLLKNVMAKYFVQKVKNNVFQGFNQISILPDRAKLAHINNKTKSVLKLFSKLETEVRNDKIKTLDYFREMKYKGNYTKVRACEDYLKDKISEVHRILENWNNLTKTDKQKAKENNMEKFFTSSFYVCKVNYSGLLSSVRESEIKRKSLQKIFNALEIKKKGLFVLWRNKTGQFKREEEFLKVIDEQKKKVILEKIEALLSGSSKETIKKALKNFHTNSKVTQVQTKFIQKLLQTKSGKVMEGFNRWKSIPKQDFENNKKGQKFYFKLEGLLKKKLKETHNEFIDKAEEGGAIKKRAVIQLLEITSLGTRRLYNRWIRITKRDHTLQQANSTMHSLDALNLCITENFKILFEDQTNVRIKTWAIEKILQSCSQNVGNYFRKWRENNRQLRIDKETKKTAISMMKHVLGGSENVQARLIIEKFQKNVAISKISRNFLNRLLKTKSGKVVQLFELWKSIPDESVARKKKLAIKFESNLNKISCRFLKFGLEPFKHSSHEARNKMRFCIERLIRACMSEEKKKFILWREINREDKILRHTHLFDEVFKKLETTYSSSFEILIKSAGEQVSKKKNLCRKLINNSNFVQHHAYFIWKEALQADNIKAEKEESRVKSHLVNLINTHEKVNNRKLVQMIACFKKKQSLKNQIAADIHKESKVKRVLGFYNQIKKYSDEKMGLFIKQASEKYKELTFLNKSKLLESFFNSIESVSYQNLMVIMKSNKQTVIMEKALNRMFSNLGYSTQKAFNLWREHKNVLAFQDTLTKDKKKNMINLLTRCLNKQEEQNIPYVIERFEKNYKSLKLRKEILSKILHCKAGKLPLAFMKWKSLPNAGDKKMKQKAMKFEGALARLASQRMKMSYDKFKDGSYEGNNKKKFAVNKLILVTMSDSNRTFNKWRKITNETKITEKIMALTQIFESSLQTLKANIPIFHSAHSEQISKENIIRRLIQNTNRNLSWAIKSWRVTVEQNKKIALDMVLERFNPEKVNTLLAREAFAKIKGKAEMEAMKTYVNSLWKWKMSNVEANYYAKFIKVFKESEELIILSNCINKKYYENIHFAFRNIMIEGNERHERKYRLVEKYFTRKLNNYFQRFKTNACFEEIKTWKNIYQETVKGKRIIEKVELLARKQVLHAFRIIQNSILEQDKGAKFISKLDTFQKLLLRSSLKSIQNYGSGKFGEKVERILDSVKLRHFKESFYLMKTTFKVEKIIEKTEKISAKVMKKYGFSKIVYKSVLAVKAKMSLNLISFMEEQKLKERIITTLKSFHKQSQRTKATNKIMNLLVKKLIENEKAFYSIINEGLNHQVLLNRFKKGMIVKKILDKQDLKAVGKIFERLRTKENKWISSSIKRFAIRTNIKASIAVSLWRLRNYGSTLP